LIYKHSYSF